MVSSLESDFYHSGFSNYCLHLLYLEHQLQLVSSSLPCSTVFSIPKKVLFFLLSFNFTQWQSPQSCKFSLLHWLLQGLVIWLRLGDSFVSQNPRGVGAFHLQVKFKLLAQFPVDHLAQPVMYSLILFLC